jgi:hypothetical protein
MKKISKKHFELITKLNIDLNKAQKELSTFVLIEKNIKDKIIDLKKQEQSITVEFEKTYGDVTIDLKNGSISKNKS